MDTAVLTATHLGPAIEALKEGQVVAFPTETVYGLGADGMNAKAARKIFEAKGRPQDNPLILHVLDQGALLHLVDGPLPRSAAALVDAFWPGPLTVVVPARRDIPAVVRAGLDTVAVRAPSHPVARALIAGLGSPIAAPSANRSGRPSPTTVEAVWDDMAGRIPYIIDGGSTSVGVESTVVDCTTDPVTLLRPGGISMEMVASVAGEVQLATDNGPVRAPGMKYRHYAPRAPVIWIESTSAPSVYPILGELERRYPKAVLIAPDRFPVPAGWDFESLGRDEASAAHRLFHAIRALDQTEPDVIVVLWESGQGLGLAIKNRIEKASSRRVRP